MRRRRRSRRRSRSLRAAGRSRSASRGTRRWRGRVPRVPASASAACAEAARQGGRTHEPTSGPPRAKIGIGSEYRRRNQPTGDSLSKLGVDALSRTRPPSADVGTRRATASRRDRGFVIDGSPEAQARARAPPVGGRRARIRAIEDLTARIACARSGVPQALRLFGCFAALVAIEAVHRPLDRLVGADGRAARRDARTHAGGAARRARARRPQGALREGGPVRVAPLRRPRARGARGLRDAAGPRAAAPIRRSRCARRIGTRRAARPVTSPSSSANRSAPRRSRKYTARGCSAAKPSR